ERRADAFVGEVGRQLRGMWAGAVAGCRTRPVVEGEHQGAVGQHVRAAEHRLAQHGTESRAHPNAAATSGAIFRDAVVDTACRDCISQDRPVKGGRYVSGSRLSSSSGTTSVIISVISSLSSETAIAQ